MSDFHWLDETEKFLKRGLEHLGREANLNVSRESETEAYIEFDGVSVFVDAEGSERNTIGGRKVKRPLWTVYNIVHYPGDRWEPPSEDLDEASTRTHETVQEAVVDALLRPIADGLFSMIEATGMADDFEEFQSYGENPLEKVQ